jgi:hypothetical protein
VAEHAPQAPEDDPAPSLAAVLADDRVVESVASGQLGGVDAPDEVVALLLAWRDTVEAEALPLHPDLDEAEVALRSATRRGWWAVPLRALSPVAAAAAAVGIALTGIGWAAHQSTPGDPLWGVSQALFVDHSRSVQAAASVSAELAEAETALASGTPELARTALQRAAADLPAVGTGEGRTDLERRHSELAARLVQVAPPAPGPTNLPTTAATTTPPPAPSVAVVPPGTTAPAPRSTTDPAAPVPSSPTPAGPTPTTTVPTPTTTVPTPTTTVPTTTTSTTTAPAPSTTPTGTGTAPAVASGSASGVTRGDQGLPTGS